MKSKRWQQIESVYQAVLDVNPSERDSFLSEKCGNDNELRREVESLLRDEPANNQFHTAAAFEIAGRAVPQDTMQSAVGQDIGSYKIHSLVGVGGMGEVYRAKDLNLGRDVAIKILPASVANDPERLSRLEREARLLAALNHPHIAAIYGFERSSGMSALVLEMVEGTTLAERLAAGPLPLEESLRFALQIAQALEAAHEKGIIHRDLKPANIKITPDGTVKVLDFGLAKAFAGAGTAHDLSQLPTLTIEPTGQGVIAGTPSYMSPEQARGNTVDKRTDIWAFGCVLYELITGRRAFAGGTVSDTIACILEREPDWSALPTATPDAIRRLLTRCLAKDLRRRLRDIGDARLDIDEAQSAPRIAGVAVQRTRSKVPLWILVSVILVVVASLAGTRFFRPTVPTPEVRFEIATPPTPDPVSLAISPDGQQIVFVATSDGRRRLWLRSLDSVSARPLAGTDGSLYPFWSPDNRSIGYFADGKLQRIDIEGGLVRTLAIAPIPWALHGTWMARSFSFRTTQDRFSGPLRPAVKLWC
jgi:eukaryotic-like serine/threonine-protein kinase